MFIKSWHLPQGVALALMTFAFKYINEDTENNGNGQKSMVKAFLSLEIWQPLGKLTYVMYLIHYTLIFPWWVKDSDLPTYYSEWNELFLVIGVWTIVASIGLILWIVMERPLSNLVTLFLKYLIGGRQRQNREMHGIQQRFIPKSVNNNEGIKVNESHR